METTRGVAVRSLHPPVLAHQVFRSGRLRVGREYGENRREPARRQLRVREDGAGREGPTPCQWDKWGWEHRGQVLRPCRRGLPAASVRRHGVQQKSVLEG